MSLHPDFEEFAAYIRGESINLPFANEAATPYKYRDQPALIQAHETGKPAHEDFLFRLFWKDEKAWGEFLFHLCVKADKQRVFFDPSISDVEYRHGIEYFISISPWPHAWFMFAEVCNGIIVAAYPHFMESKMMSFLRTPESTVIENPGKEETVPVIFIISDGKIMSLHL